VTGVNYLTLELGPKRLGLLHDLVPGAALVAILVNPSGPIRESIMQDVEAAAATVGQRIEFFHTSNKREIDAAFASLVQKRAGACLVMPDPLFVGRRVQLVSLAAYHRIPEIYSSREFAEVGGLMTYGSSLALVYRQAGVYTGRILKGEKPADLPVMQPTKFEFVISLQT
jgi:ABC-type uncharacterized transport system substrate-binding protein